MSQISYVLMFHFLSTFFQSKQNWRTLQEREADNRKLSWVLCQLLHIQRIKSWIRSTSKSSEKERNISLQRVRVCYLLLSSAPMDCQALFQKLAGESSSFYSSGNLTNASHVMKYSQGQTWFLILLLLQLLYMLQDFIYFLVIFLFFCHFHCILINGYWCFNFKL